ncbi:MAG: bifunctional methylenetetrahydrofolate dehydrogenase/methenyltetrahydrofolate cyclohydrolase FolD [Bacilli bacterium]|nr:bifunctional methylenetetrahydrofolate dehydrogenase/methenyltetrahydrofolate cyclohydrolase FolD [Bacilli bacterium]
MILDGKMVSSKIREDIKNEISSFSIKPKLVDIQIGHNEASDIYIKNKEKACLSVGIEFECVRFEESSNEEDIVRKIEELNNDKRINGILIQSPIPDKFDFKDLVNHIDPEKDVDGLTNINIGKLANNIDGMVSCTPFGIMKLLEYYEIDLTGKNVVIVGRSNLVGKPLFNLMLNKNATVTICHSKTVDLKLYTKNADILVVAVGSKHLIKEDMVKEGSVVIDVGINRVDGVLYGDVDFNSIYEHVSYITPVPGGVGPMTVAMLLYNTVKNYKKSNIF